MNHNEILHIWWQHCCLPLLNERPMAHWRTSCYHPQQQLIYHVSMLHVFFKTRVCQTIYHIPTLYLLHLLSILQLTTTMLLSVRTMHRYRRHQKQTAGSRLLLLCPPYCLQWLVTTSSRAKMAARLLPGQGQGRAFQMVTKTHCRPKSLSNCATAPFRPIIYLVFQGKAVFFTVS